MARSKQETKLSKQKKWLRTIRKGWEHMGKIKSDLPATVRTELPTLDMFKAEINRLAEVNHVEPKPRVNNWKFSNCVNWLETQEPEVPEVGNDQEASDTNEAESASGMLGAQISPRRSGTSSTLRQLSPGGRSNWSTLKCAPRLINVIALMLKTDYLDRDKTLSRLEIDAKGQNWFWNKLAETFNTDDNPDFDENMFVDDMTISDQVRNLIPGRPDGLIASASMLKEKHRDLRTVIQKAMNKFQDTGNGDNADTDLADGQVRSNDLSSYFSNNPAIYYVFLVLKKFSLLESFKVIMPDECKSTVTSRSKCAYGKKRKRSNDNRNPDSSAMVDIMKDAMTAGITINSSHDKILSIRSKRLKNDAECQRSRAEFQKSRRNYLKDLTSEYKDILTDLKDDDLDIFLRETQEKRKVSLQEEIEEVSEELTNLRESAPLLAPNISSTSHTGSSPLSVAPMNPPPASLLLTNDDDDLFSDGHPLAPASSHHSEMNDDLQTPCDMPNCRVKHGLSVLPSTHVCGNCGVNLHAECCADDQNTVAGGHVFKCDACFRLKSTQ